MNSVILKYLFECIIYYSSYELLTIIKETFLDNELEDNKETFIKGSISRKNKIKSILFHFFLFTISLIVLYYIEKK